jgi:excinuclease ABC subunit B
MSPFQLSPEFHPRGDQAQAIAKLVKSLAAGNRHQTLLGVTGSGKTFTMANVIAEAGRPALVFSHNKTLAAQLYSEFKNFFPNNAVEYFVSYFDYYQPEAYIPRTDTYIEKDSSINDEIERLRLSSMGALITRRDVIVVASVSCIYGLGSPEDYEGMMLPLHTGQAMSRETLLARLVDMLYERNDIQLKRGCFRARGDVVEIIPAYLESEAIRIEFFGDEIDRLSVVDALTGRVTLKLPSYTLFPAKQFVTPGDKLRKAVVKIRAEMEERVAWFEKEGKLLEAQRLKMRTEHDIEMMQEMGFCQGIENYSRHLTGREPGATPGTLLDFFDTPPLVFIDESHATLPQIGGMYEGDRSRKTVLVEHGFRLPSALDNRPLKFPEFMDKVGQLVYVSATPARFELENSVVGNTAYIPQVRAEAGPTTAPLVRVSGSAQPVEQFDVSTRGRSLVVEQVIRPTGLLDPIITVKPLEGQIDETIELCRQRIEKNERVLVTTLTKRTAEDLTDYLRNLDLRVRYLHSDIDAIERVEILRSLRRGDCDVLVGINLLREGLDLPEVSLVCILDADKEGFLRSETSLIQTAGRAARHVNGEVVLFADLQTRSIQALLAVSGRRRQVQMEHNAKHGITPQTVRRAVQESLQILGKAREVEASVVREGGGDFEVTEVIRELEAEMAEAATKLEFERAALLRDQIRELKARESGEAPPAKAKPVTYGKPKRGGSPRKR